MNVSEAPQANSVESEKTETSPIQSDQSENKEEISQPPAEIIPESTSPPEEINTQPVVNEPPKEINQAPAPEQSQPVKSSSFHIEEISPNVSETSPKEDPLPENAPKEQEDSSLTLKPFLRTSSLSTKIDDFSSMHDNFSLEISEKISRSPTQRRSMDLESTIKDSQPVSDLSKEKQTKGIQMEDDSLSEENFVHVLKSIR